MCNKNYSENEEENTEMCPICGHTSEFIEYNDNLKKLRCNSCGILFERPNGEAGSDSLSVEDLRNISKFTRE